MPYKVLVAAGFLAMAAFVVVMIAGVLSDRTVSAQSDAETYCRSAGGAVVERTPVLNAASAHPMLLDGAIRFCEFTGGAGAEPADSRIAIGLETLAAVGPTRAALAYLARAPLPEALPPSSPGLANPASVYCASLGGAEGDWIAESLRGPERVVTMCVFPDRSLIDSWGLAYHAMGAIRGADLTPLLRYRTGAATPES
ncbi:MAG: DUF333 domain-containing protein [Thermomicrobiales bacterium]|nr:DUF333 domain-containing protein [Thermomicrobiales bacterium]